MTRSPPAANCGRSGVLRLRRRVGREPSRRGEARLRGRRIARRYVVSRWGARELRPSCRPSPRPSRRRPAWTRRWRRAGRDLAPFYAGWRRPCSRRLIAPGRGFGSAGVQSAMTRAPGEPGRSWSSRARSRPSWWRWSSSRAPLPRSRGEGRDAAGPRADGHRPRGRGRAGRRPSAPTTARRGTRRRRGRRPGARSDALYPHLVRLPWTSLRLLAEPCAAVPAASTSARSARSAEPTRPTASWPPRLRRRVPRRPSRPADDVTPGDVRARVMAFERPVVVRRNGLVVIADKSEQTGAEALAKAGALPTDRLGCWASRHAIQCGLLLLLARAVAPFARRRSKEPRIRFFSHAPVHLGTAPSCTPISASWLRRSPARSPGSPRCWRTN